METREQHQHEMESTMKEWGARLDALKARADKASADAKVELHKQSEELGKLQDAARKHYEELKSSSKDAWHDMKKDAESRWSALTASFEALWTKVKA